MEKQEAQEELEELLADWSMVKTTKHLNGYLIQIARRLKDIGENQMANDVLERKGNVLRGMRFTEERRNKILLGLAFALKRKKIV